MTFYEKGENCFTIIKILFYLKVEAGVVPPIAPGCGLGASQGGGGGDGALCIERPSQKADQRHAHIAGIELR